MGGGGGACRGGVELVAISRFTSSQGPRTRLCSDGHWKKVFPDVALCRQPSLFFFRPSDSTLSRVPIVCQLAGKRALVTVINVLISLEGVWPARADAARGGPSFGAGRWRAVGCHAVRRPIKSEQSATEWEGGGAGLWLQLR